MVFCTVMLDLFSIFDSKIRNFPYVISIHTLNYQFSLGLVQYFFPVYCTFMKLCPSA